MSPGSQIAAKRPAPVAPPARDSPFWIRHAFALAAGAVCLAICFWMITEGTGTLLIHRGFDTFYDGQANSLMHGHWDVDRDDISGEAFLVHGKYYGYFPFTPALPRILLDGLFPSRYGQWTRLLLLLWIASVIAAILAFMEHFEVASSPSFVVLAVLGSTLFFLCSHAAVYYEAVMTGSALALWSYLFFCRYLAHPRIGLLGVACVLSFFSFFARFSVGAGPMLAASFLCAGLLLRRFGLGRIRESLDWLKFPSPSGAGAHAAILAVCLAVTATTYLSINHAKWGMWLTPAPYQYHVQYDAARMARIGGSFDRLGNIPYDFGAYFGPDRMKFGISFPWFRLTDQGPGPGSTAKPDVIEGYSSIPDAMPALAILSLLGIAFAVRRARSVLPIAAAAFAAGCLILPIAYIAFRYVHDFYPFLVISSILGVGAIQTIANRSARVVLKVAIVLAGLWSIAACSALTLRWQRVDFWADPAANAAYLRLRERVESWLPSWKRPAIVYKIGDSMEYLRPGQLLTTADPPSTYQYDGHIWHFVSGVPMHRFRLVIKFPLGATGRRAPLWFAGNANTHDAVYIEYVNPSRVQFCSDHTDRGTACGSSLEIDPNREYRMQIDADRLNGTLTVAVDGKMVLEGPMQFHVWNDRDALFGKSLVPSIHGGDFAGEVRRDQ